MKCFQAEDRNPKKNTTSDYMTKISHLAQAEISAWFELPRLKILDRAEIRASSWQTDRVTYKHDNLIVFRLFYFC